MGEAVSTGSAEPALRRRVTLFGATVYGIGNILGAGIYALIGEVVGITGNFTWAAFLIAASIGILTGLTYAELSAMYPKSAAEFVFVDRAFRTRILSFTLGWVVIFSGLFSAATVALGFGGYLAALLDIPGIYAIMIFSIALIAALSIINYIGIKESTLTNILFTLIEAFGLVLIIAVGIPYLGTVDYLVLPPQVPFAAIFSAVALIFFAYIGFEDIANIAEEVKTPERTLPRAIVYSVVVTTILYCLTSVAVVSILPYEVVASVPDPLNAVATAAIGPAGGVLMSLIALFATANTVFIILIVTSRMIYGMSRDDALPKILGRISLKRGTPTISVLLVMIIAMALVFFQDLTFVANATVFGVLVTFLFVNLSLIILRRREAGTARPFRAPSVGSVPLTALLGGVVCMALLFTFDLWIIATQFVIVVIGIVVYYVLKGTRRRGCP